jgi:hypothetical protein
MTSRKLAGSVLIVLFVAITAFIGFFHTETTPKPNPACPACQLQASSLAVHEIDCSGNPELQFFAYVVAVVHSDYDQLVSPDLPNRSPPRG